MQIPWEAVVAVIIYTLSSTLGFVWWMATQTMRLQMMGEDLKEMKESVVRSEAIYARKEDVVKDFVHVDQQITALWRKVDRNDDK